MIENVVFDYNIANGIQWDLNTEGNGVQPMLCKVNIQFKFTADDLTGLKVVVTDGENVLETLTPDPSDKDTNGRYYVTFGKLNAGQMRKTVYATVMQGTKKVSNTMQYSIESYAAAQSNSTVANLPELLHAMMRYGDSAKAVAEMLGQ